MSVATVLALVLALGLASLARWLRRTAGDPEALAALALSLFAASPWPQGVAVGLVGLACALWLHLERARVERQRERVAAHLASIGIARISEKRVPPQGIDDVLATSALAAVEARVAAHLARPPRKPRPPGVRARFMAAMGHELRSPLNSISGFAQLLEDGSDGPLNDAQRENVVLVRRAADELIALLTDILDAARIEAGRIRLERAWIAPVEVLTAALERMRAETETDEVSVEIEVQPGLEALYVDRGRLGQAVYNVLRAVARGRAKIVARVREVTEAGRPVLRFELHDRSSPLGPADAARAFDPDPAARSQGRSLALGLALSVARDLAQLHGGGARAEALDGGTNWLLWVPSEPSEEPPARRPRELRRAIRGDRDR